MANLGELETEITDLAARDNTEFTDLIPTFVNRAIRRVTSENNFWFMKTTLVQGITEDEGAQYLAPSDMKEPDEIYLILSASNSFKSLDRITLSDALVLYGPNQTVGEPEAVVLENVTMTFMPPPDQDYDIYIVYYSRFPELSESTDENFLTIYKKDLIVYGALSAGFGYMQEWEEAKIWDTKFKEEMVLLMRENTSRALAGEVTLIPKADSNALNSTERSRVGTGSPLKGYY